ncbi:hypothetical protein [Leptospira stimsonii]|uniref:hypothetical protein n=1 Tax=Leptospira stimsonii TaxID=2202203 RepID=UPI0011C3AC6C|nr:hypothetical protein [Leptospira stimsonii]
MSIITLGFRLFLICLFLSLKGDLFSQSCYWEKINIGFGHPIPRNVTEFIPGLGYRIIKANFKRDIFEEEDIVLMVNDCSASRFITKDGYHFVNSTVRYLGFNDSYLPSSAILLRENVCFKFYKEAENIKKINISCPIGEVKKNLFDLKSISSKSFLTKKGDIVLRIFVNDRNSSALVKAKKDKFYVAIYNIDLEIKENNIIIIKNDKKLADLNLLLNEVFINKRIIYSLDRDIERIPARYFAFL